MGEFRITGPGTYRTRNGETATVDHYSLKRNPWVGKNNQGCNLCWDEEGSLDGLYESRFDLVARIDEPQTEMAILVYYPLIRNAAGLLVDGPPFEREEQAWAFQVPDGCSVWRVVPVKAIVKPAPEPQTEMAGLNGFISIFGKSANDGDLSLQLGEVFGLTPQEAFSERSDSYESHLVIDLSTIRKDQLVEPEPKRETRKVWIVHDCYGVTTVLGEKPSVSVGDRLTPNDALISHIREQDVSFLLVAGDAS